MGQNYGPKVSIPNHMYSTVLKYWTFPAYTPESLHDYSATASGVILPRCTVYKAALFRRLSEGEETACNEPWSISTWAQHLGYEPTLHC
jgi:hypothetical protein